jgi:outer membrane protein
MKGGIRMRKYLYMSMFLISAAGTARAKVPESMEYESPFRVTVGIGMGSGPKFEGSNEYAIMPIPIISMEYGSFFLSPMGGVGMRVPVEGFVISPALRVRPERNINSDGGLGDRTTSLRLAGGAGIVWNAGGFSLGADVSQGLSEKNKGWTYDLEAGYSRPISAEWSYTAKVSAMYADRDYNQTYFGITSDESVRTGYETYYARAGFKHVGLGGSLNHVIDKDTMLGIFASYRRLIGPAADSPIVERGSKDQVTLAVMMLWRL